MPAMKRPRGGEGTHAGAGPATGILRVGAALRQERERRGLALGDVARATRFTVRQVLAVEEGRLADLPPHPYARGLVTAYASLLGLDPEATAREWGQVTGGGAAARRSVFRVPAHARSSWRDWAVPIACAAATVAYLALAPAPGPAPEPGLVPPPAPTQPAAEAPQPEQDAEVAPAPEPTAPQDAPGVAVELRSEGATWVDVAADGGEQRRQELRPGQNLSLQARRRLALALGDAGAVRISVNGRDLGFIGDKGELKAGIVFDAPPATAATKGPPAIAPDRASGR
jgi:transcriptional regulator with XRE-family HTH domain